MSSSSAKKTLIVGLGNPLLGDDGVGWRVADQIRVELKSRPVLNQDVEVIDLALGGLRLMEQMIGYSNVIIIDSLNLGLCPVGKLYCLELEELPELSGGHLGSTHDTTLQAALKIASQIGASVPAKITIVGIESPYTYEFSETLSPPVSAAIPAAVKIAMELLECQHISQSTG